MRKTKYLNKKAVNYGGVFFATVLLLVSAIAIGIPSSFAEDRLPKYIFGSAEDCLGSTVSGASVLVEASGLPDETTTTDSSGNWQVDVGGDGGQTEWPDGTSFTVTITKNGWEGTTTGTVSGSATNVGVVVLDPPTLVASASGTPTTIIEGDTVSFTGSATGGATPYTSWSWDFDDGGSSSVQNPSHQFNTAGTYNVELTVTDSCSNTDSDTVTITVNPALSCDAGGPYSGTICNPVSFSGSGNGGVPPYSFSWDFGDGSSGSGANPSHQYDSDGSYTATLTVTDANSDTAVDTASVTISTTPLSADAGGPYSGTVCNPVSFSGSASGGCSPYSYSWDFGDGSTGSGANPSHQYDDDGSYTATLTVTDANSDTAVDTATVSISTTPLTGNAGGPYSGYADESVDFSGSASGGCSPYSYSWDFGDGNTGSGQNPTHTYDDDGTYTVTLTVTDDVGTTDVDTTTAEIEEPSITADAGGPYYGTVGEEVDFDGSASDGQPPYDWFWDFGDGTSSTDQNPSHIYSAPGQYDVILVVTDDNDNSDSDTAIAYISGEDPVADAGGPYLGAPGEDINFDGSVLGGTEPYTWDWDFGDGSSSTLEDPVHSYDAVGEYTVTLTVTDDEGKTSTDTTTASISDAPKVPDLVCSGSLNWPGVESGAEVSDSFTVSNDGDTGSFLDWEIVSEPDWGTWTFTPSSGSGLTPADGDVTIEVSVVAPTPISVPFFSDADDETYQGEIVVENVNDPSDSCTVSVTMVVPHVQNPWVWLWNMLCERFPILEQFFGL